MQLSESSINKLADSCDIIVLGGDNYDDKNLSPNNQLSSISLSCLVEGIRIHRMTRGSRLIPHQVTAKDQSCHMRLFFTVQR
ncbi:MAG: hypothetical protein NT144_10000 [Bacteroidia bacterium]|nr:hypothetical protein [Bacteroidia bacterium]